MDVKAALKAAVEESGWPAERVALEAHVSFGTARRWLAGENTPGGDALIALMRALPGFPERLGFVMKPGSDVWPFRGAA